MLASVEQTAVEIKARVADLESALQKGDRDASKENVT
jgi:hypothetical protein